VYNDNQKNDTIVHINEYKQKTNELRKIVCKMIWRNMPSAAEVSETMNFVARAGSREE